MEQWIKKLVALEVRKQEIRDAQQNALIASDNALKATLKGIEDAADL